MSNQVNLEALINQAQKMQSKVKEAHDALAKMIITGHAGDEEAGVGVEMNGQHHALKVVISIALLKILLDNQASAIGEAKLKEMADTLGQIIVEAINNAVQKVGDASRQKLSVLAADIQPSLIDQEN